VPVRLIENVKIFPIGLMRPLKKYTTLNPYRLLKCLLRLELSCVYFKAKYYRFTSTTAIFVFVFIFGAFRTDPFCTLDIKCYAYKNLVLVLYFTSLNSGQFRQYNISLTSLFLLKQTKGETKIKNEEKHKVVFLLSEVNCYWRKSGVNSDS